MAVQIVDMQYQASPEVASPGEENPRFRAIREAIEHAAAVQNTKYECIDGFSLSYADDDSGAREDVATFEQMCRELGARIIKSLVLTVGMTPCAIGVWCELEITKTRPKSRNLVILHYAGHGEVDPSNGSLRLCARQGSDQSFPWMLFVNRFVAPPYIVPDRMGMKQTDVLVILDCCYAGACPRGLPEASRTGHVIAATAEYSTTKCRNTNFSFTQQVAGMVRRIGREKLGSPFEIGDVMARIIGEDVIYGLNMRPVHDVLDGRSPIVLHYPVSDNSDTFSATYQYENVPAGQVLDLSLATTNASLEGTTPKVEVLCAIQFDGDITEESLKKFATWINTLDSSFNIQVEYAYAADSTFMCARVPASIWARLEGLDGFQFLSYSFGPDPTALCTWSILLPKH
ncbi:hypothetical protein BZA05DRAFT_418645 [Tricharina praecox]|uniref:uncharacterized protein n=1 Tax=Tricharina praecox TaxID=43433 RepID=UPI00221F06E4|nr:uncharacterized protein BZA05DRAFT_418645 [Tricharina praecox]KAI5852369.1 hypothetical protein BZA05DRAFT_418645 [Tricharina praecox]